VDCIKARFKSLGCMSAGGISERYLITITTMGLYIYDAEG